MVLAEAGHAQEQSSSLAIRELVNAPILPSLVSFTEPKSQRGLAGSAGTFVWGEALLEFLIPSTSTPAELIQADTMTLADALTGDSRSLAGPERLH
ncbi:hypothetical protein [Bradyrhizobium embrapense]